MKTLICSLVLLAAAIDGIAADKVASNATVAVTARITALPEPFMFPGCDCGKHAKPYTCEVTTVVFIVPKDLEGKTMSIYHREPLSTDSVWKKLDATLLFSIDAKALGSLYPQSDKRHTDAICYSHYVHGEPKILKERQ